MTNLDNAARRLNEHPVAEPAPVEQIYQRAVAIRRRTNRWRGVLAAGATLAVTAAVVGVARQPAGHTRLVAIPPSTSVSVSPPPSVPPPTRLVAHLPTSTGHPGQIVIIDTGTGLVTKVLGADYDPYVGDGFHVGAGGQSVFWTRLDEARQEFPITEARLDGGGSRTIGQGFYDLPSPDGQLLLVRAAAGPNSLKVVDLASGAERTLPVPPVGGQVLTSVSWMAASRTVLALSTTPAQVCSVPPGGSCPTTTTPFHVAARAWTIDATTPGAQWMRSSSAVDWGETRLLGPGRLAGTVVVTQSAGATATALVTLRPDGTVIDRVVTNEPQDQILAVDHGGTNFLVQDTTGLARVSLTNVVPIRVGSAVSEASWW